MVLRAGGGSDRRRACGTEHAGDWHEGGANLPAPVPELAALARGRGRLGTGHQRDLGHAAARRPQAGRALLEQRPVRMPPHGKVLYFVCRAFLHRWKLARAHACLEPHASVRTLFGASRKAWMRFGESRRCVKATRQAVRRKCRRSWSLYELYSTLSR